jgi:hypothetical protein
MRQEDCKFEASLGYLSETWLQKVIIITFIALIPKGKENKTKLCGLRV